MLTLYYYPLNASMAVRFVLHKTNAPHQLVLVDRVKGQQKSSDYLKLNPTGRIPTLLDKDLVLFESPAICMYVANRYPEYELIPKQGTTKRVKFDQWLMYLTNTLQAELAIYHYPSRYADSNEAQKFVKIAAEDRIASMLNLLDSQLREGDYLVSSTVGICDYFLFMLCVWADELVMPPLSYEHLGAYLRRLASFSEIASVCQHEGLSLDDY